MEQSIWDIDQVLYYLSSLPSYSKLDLMQLTQKTVMLVLLASMRRKIDVARLTINNVIKTSTKFTFQLNIPSKNYNPRYTACHLLEIERLPRRPEICPYTALTFYLRHTKNLHTTKSVFIVTNGKGTAAHTSTIARWATTVMDKAGIDITKFKGHSTRSASASKGLSKFMPLKDILACGKWRTSHTFFRNYCQQVEHFQPPAIHVKVRQAQFKKETVDKIQKKYFSGMKKTPRRGEMTYEPLPLTVENVKKCNNLIHNQLQVLLLVHNYLRL